jgi:outer membrane protein TolC
MAPDARPQCQGGGGTGLGQSDAGGGGAGAGVLQAARAALDALDQKLLAQRHQLNALLGLAPDATVPLADQIDLPPFDPAAIRASLASLPDRRPDLLALRMGYGQADEQVRQAILSQFPDLVLGGAVSSDNSRVINGGPNATVGLPIFDRRQARSPSPMPPARSSMPITRRG